MTLVICLIATIVVLDVFFLLLSSTASAYLKFRGTRLVTCPEIKEPAAVEMDAKYAAFAVPFGERGLRLKDCSRWPERQDCGQQCLGQIVSAPEDCLVRNIFTKWYEGKTCAFCGKALGEIDWLDHKPALMSPERVTLEWNEIPAEKVPVVLQTHMPVCWDCHIAETFRGRYPELIVDRPWKPGESHRSSKLVQPSKGSSPRRSAMSKDTLTITDNRTGRNYEIPIQNGTIRSTDLRQIKISEDDFGLMGYDPAL